MRWCIWIQSRYRVTCCCRRLTSSCFQWPLPQNLQTFLGWRVEHDKRPIWALFRRAVITWARTHSGHGLLCQLTFRRNAVLAGISKFLTQQPSNPKLPKSNRGGKVVAQKDCGTCPIGVHFVFSTWKYSEHSLGLLMCEEYPPPSPTPAPPPHRFSFSRHHVHICQTRFLGDSAWGPAFSCCANLMTSWFTSIVSRYHS